MRLCPCKSNLEYIACCGVYHSNQGIPSTPEALMRSRFTAYTMANISYIKKTMHGKPLMGFNEVAAAKWSQSVHWLNLAIIKTYQGDEDIGFVEFEGTYMDHNYIKIIHETSKFQVINGFWFYVDGEQVIKPPIKIARNTPCPCGSKKKFKNCHAQN